MVRPVALVRPATLGLLLAGALGGSWFAGAESASAARSGLLAYSVDEGEETCDQCGPDAENITSLGGAWVETVRPDGTHRRRIGCVYRRPRGCRYGDPTFSHDGRRLAVNGRQGLVVMTPSGKRIARIKNDAWFHSPTWAPGDRKLAFARVLPGEEAPDGTTVAGVFLTDLRGRERLLNRADTFSVSWSRQGRLTWTSPTPHEGEWPHIWVGNPDGSQATRVARKGDTPDWSPDGRQVAFTCHREARGLCVVSAKGGPVRFITRRCISGFDDYTGIAWSPDGKEIACESTRGGLIAVNLRTRTIRAIVRPGRMRADIEEIDWQPIPLR